MANYSVLKAAVEAVVKTNGNQEITGANMQSTLISIINSLGTGYQFMGVATPSTSPGTPDYNVAYIGGAGTYANFGTSVTVPVGSICVFKYNGSWTKEQIDVCLDDVIAKANVISLDNAIQWKAGNIDPSTGQILPSSNNNYYSSIFPAGLIKDGITCDYFNTRTFCIAYYDENNNFQSRSSYVPNKFDWNTISPSQRIRIVVATVNVSDTLSIDEVLTGIRFLSINNKNISDKIDNLLSGCPVSYKDPDLFVVGTLNENGNIIYLNSNKAIFTRNVIIGKSIIQLPNTMQYNLAYYNNGVFQSRGDWVVGNGNPQIIDADEYKVIIAKVTAETYTEYGVSDTLENVQLFCNEAYANTYGAWKASQLVNLAVFPYNVDNYVFKNIDNNGNEIDPATGTSNYASVMVSAGDYSYLKITSKRQGYLACVAKWDGVTGNFIERTSYSDNIELENDNQYSVRYVLFAPNRTETLSEIFDAFDIEVAFEQLSPLNSYIKSQSANTQVKQMQYPLLAFNGKFMHFSVDDSVAIWRALINNPSVTSIFDTVYFGALKELHDATGMCVTINLFCCDAIVGETPTITLSDIPNTWASEFQANSDWLNFSLHSYFTDQKYGTPVTGHSLLQDFTYCNTQIERFTGTKDCISRQLRLGYFNCPSEEEAVSIANIQNGVKIYSTADDNRTDNMYLDGNQREEMNSKGLLYDTNNELVFIKSMPRLDDATNISAIISTLQQVKGTQKVLEMFCHESSYITYKTAMINLFNSLKSSNGYDFAFLADLFNN